jgi:hypothetical protein
MARSATTADQAVTMIAETIVDQVEMMTDLAATIADPAMMIDRASLGAAS